MNELMEEAMEEEEYSDLPPLKEETKYKVVNQTLRIPGNYLLDAKTCEVLPGRPEIVFKSYTVTVACPCSTPTVINALVFTERDSQVICKSCQRAFALTLPISQSYFAKQLCAFDGLVLLKLSKDAETSTNEAQGYTSIKRLIEGGYANLSHCRWDDNCNRQARNDAIIQDYQAGASIQSLATQHSISKTRVHHILAAAGVVGKNSLTNEQSTSVWRLKQEGKTMKQIAQTLDISLGKVKTCVRKYQRMIDPCKEANN